MKRLVFFKTVILMAGFLFSEAVCSNSIIMHSDKNSSISSVDLCLRRSKVVPSISQIVENGYAVFSQDVHSPNLVFKAWGGEWVAQVKGFSEADLGGIELTGKQIGELKDMKAEDVEKEFGLKPEDKITVAEFRKRFGDLKVLIGESWEISGYPGKTSTVIADGSKISLPDIIAQNPAAVLGQAVVDKFGSEKIPLLIKLLDCNQDLSLQVHPGQSKRLLIYDPQGTKQGDDNSYVVAEYDYKTGELSSPVAADRFKKETGQAIPQVLTTDTVLPEGFKMKKLTTKSEAWVIVGVNDDKPHQLWVGFKDGVTKDNLGVYLKELSKASSYDEQVKVLNKFLNQVTVQPGEYYNIPTGTVHALGAGIQLVEVQESGDTTLHFWDWGRAGRYFHNWEIEQSVRESDYSGKGLEAFQSKIDNQIEHSVVNEVIRNNIFVIDQISLRKEDISGETRGSFHALTVTGGIVEIKDNNGRVIATLGKGHPTSMMISASFGEYSIHPVTDAAEIVRSYVPVK